MGCHAEGRRVHVPAARLHARYRDGRDRFRGRQNGQVQHAILFSADQFFAIDQQDGLGRLVCEAQLGDGSPTGQLGDLGQTLRDGILGQQIIRDGAAGVGPQQRKQRQIAEGGRSPDRDPGRKSSLRDFIVGCLL